MPDQPENQTQSAGARTPGLESLVGQAIFTPAGEAIGRVIAHEREGAAPTVRMTTPGADDDIMMDVQSRNRLTNYMPPESIHTILLSPLARDAYYGRRYIPPSEFRNYYQGEFDVPLLRRVDTPRQNPRTYPRWWRQALQRMEHLRILTGELPRFPEQVHRHRGEDERHDMLMGIFDGVEIHDVEMRASADIGGEFTLEASAVGTYQGWLTRINFTGVLQDGGHLGDTRLTEVRVDRPVGPNTWALGDVDRLAPVNEEIVITATRGYVRADHRVEALPETEVGTRVIDLMMGRLRREEERLLMPHIMGVDAGRSGHDPAVAAQHAAQGFHAIQANAAVYMASLGRTPTISESLALAADSWKMLGQPSSLTGSEVPPLNRRQRRAERFRHRMEGRYTRSNREQLDLHYSRTEDGRVPVVLGVRPNGSPFTSDDFVDAMQSIARVGEQLVDGLVSGLTAVNEVARQLTENYRTLINSTAVAQAVEDARTALGYTVERYQDYMATARVTQERMQAQERQNAARAQQKALETARELLKSRLTEEQQSTYEKLGSFDVVLTSEQLGGFPGRRYRIDSSGFSHNIRLIAPDDLNTVLQSFCVHPSNYDLPQPDVMLAQKLMIELNHTEFLHLANVSTYPEYEDSVYARGVRVNDPGNPGQVEVVVDEQGRPRLRRGPRAGTRPNAALREAALIALVEEGA